MKINLYSIIPANVRYDRTLYDKSILLFGEISAAANAYGICDEDNRYFANALNVDPRTITRCLGQLLESGHIDKVQENGKRRIKIVQRGLEPPIGVDIQTDAIVPKEDISGFVTQFLETWEKAVATTVDKKQMYTDVIAQRLINFSKDELLQALRNRSNFVNKSEWHRNPDNRQGAISVDTWIRSDESVRKWLNAKVEVEDKPLVKAFKRN